MRRERHSVNHTASEAVRIFNRGHLSHQLSNGPSSPGRSVIRPKASFIKDQQAQTSHAAICSLGNHILQGRFIKKPCSPEQGTIANLASCQRHIGKTAQRDGLPERPKLTFTWFVQARASLLFVFQDALLDSAWAPDVEIKSAQSIRTYSDGVTQVPTPR